MKKTYLTNWKMNGAITVLTYSNGECVNVSTNDFNRAFGAIINATKEDVIRYFGMN